MTTYTWKQSHVHTCSSSISTNAMYTNCQTLPIWTTMDFPWKCWSSLLSFFKNLNPFINNRGSHYALPAISYSFELDHLLSKSFPKHWSASTIANNMWLQWATGSGLHAKYFATIPTRNSSFLANSHFINADVITSWFIFQLLMILFLMKIYMTDFWGWISWIKYSFLN